jgi:hypothetical protein
MLFNLFGIAVWDKENIEKSGHRVLAVDPMAENLAYIHKSLGNIKFSK